MSKVELSSSSIIAFSYTVTLLFLNSSLNPFLYCWKIDEVKQAMKETISPCGTIQSLNWSKKRKMEKKMDEKEKEKEKEKN